MEYTPCPKCGSRSTHVSVTRAPYIGQPPDQVLICNTCGKRVYGAEAVEALVSESKKRVQEARRAAEKKAREAEAIRAAIQRGLEEARRETERRAAEEAAREAARVEAKRAAEEARRARTLEEIMQNAKCAWPPCPNDHTMSSKYCSRTCSDKNAHARAKAKKEAAKAATSAQQPTPSHHESEAPSPQS